MLTSHPWQSYSNTALSHFDHNVLLSFRLELAADSISIAQIHCCCTCKLNTWMNAHDNGDNDDDDDYGHGDEGWQNDEGQRMVEGEDVWCTSWISLIMSIACVRVQSACTVGTLQRILWKNAFKGTPCSKLYCRVPKSIEQLTRPACQVKLHSLDSALHINWLLTSTWGCLYLVGPQSRFTTLSAVLAETKTRFNWFWSCSIHGQLCILPACMLSQCCCQKKWGW